MSYHKKKITKGKFGEFSKIREEFEELEDANKQDVKILELCEIADLYGAMRKYVENKFNMKISDIESMCNLTESSFKDGTRK